ncbi:MAG: peptidase C39 [Eubacterium sp.]
MKNPLHYQLSEYDCGPTSVLNAVSFLFDREQIPPEILRNVMLYCLDCHSPDGTPGKSGTSCSAMMFLSNWLDNFGRVGILPVSSQYISGEQVYFGSASMLTDALVRGGAAVARIFLDEWHYVLFTGLKDGSAYLFDPYFMDKPFDDENIICVEDKPYSYNRIIPCEYFNRSQRELYSFADVDLREAVIIFNNDTKITAEDTVEYFI